MKTKYLYIALVVMLLLGICYSTIAITESDDKKTGVLSTGLEDQTGVAVTIYNVNLGLVKDQRGIKLLKGAGEVRFMDVASQIIPTSVYIKSPIDPESLQILEQNYEYAQFITRIYKDRGIYRRVQYPCSKGQRGEAYLQG